MEVLGEVKKNLVPVVSKTLDVLECFRSPEEQLTLGEITKRTGVSHTTAFRILFTLVHRRYLVRRGTRYQLSRVRHKIKVGFCATMALPLSAAIAESLKEAAEQAAVEVVIRDNEWTREQALENARSLVAEGIDIAIVFQRFHQYAPAISDVFQSAKVPLIAVHVPHPGAIYFGPDNYRTGVAAGVALGHHATKNGRHNLLILLEILEAGTPLQTRISGVVDGFRKIVPGFPEERIVHLNGAGDREKSREVVDAALRGILGNDKLLFAAASDYSALGALDAIRALNLTGRCGIISHDGNAEALEQIEAPGSPFLGTVAFFPERYGQELVGLVLRLLKGHQVPPFNYVGHELVTKDTVSAMLAKKNARAALK